MGLGEPAGGGIGGGWGGIERGNGNGSGWLDGMGSVMGRFERLLLAFCVGWVFMWGLDQSDWDVILGYCFTGEGSGGLHLGGFIGGSTLRWGEIIIFYQYGKQGFAYGRVHLGGFIRGVHSGGGR